MSNEEMMKEIETRFEYMRKLLAARIEFLMSPDPEPKSKEDKQK